MKQDIGESIHLRNWRPEDGQPEDWLIATDAHVFMGPTCRYLEPRYNEIRDALQKGTLIQIGKDIFETTEGHPVLIALRTTGLIKNLPDWHELVQTPTGIWRGQMIAKYPGESCRYEGSWGACNAIVAGPSGILYGASFHGDRKEPCAVVRRPLRAEFGELTAWLQQMLGCVGQP